MLNKKNLDRIVNIILVIVLVLGGAWYFMAYLTQY